MKKIILFLLLGSFSLQGQTFLDSLSFYESLWPTLVPYDSVTYSRDSGVAFSPNAVFSMKRFPNGKIDSATVFENGVAALAYSGTDTIPGITNVLEYDISGMQPQAIGRYEYQDDTLRQDSVTSYYVFTAGNPVLVQELTYNFDLFDRLSSLLVKAQTGSGLSPVAEIRYFYDFSGKLDSADQVSPQFNQVVQIYGYTYADSVLKQFEVLQINPTSGEFDLLYRYHLKNNAAGKIIQATELIFDSQAGALVLSRVMRFDVRKNSNIGLKEEMLSKVEIYPNPAENLLYVESEDEFLEYEIFNLLGKKVGAGNFENAIAISNLPKGIYVLKLNGAQGAVSHKFLKN